jgi:hypothetical protein
MYLRTAAPRNATMMLQCYNVPFSGSQNRPVYAARRREHRGQGLSTVEISSVSGRPWDAAPNRCCAEAGGQPLNQPSRRASPLAR